jgi:hypothetical protein
VVVPAAQGAAIQKTLFALEEARADIARKRHRWCSTELIDATRLRVAELSVRI